MSRQWTLQGMRRANKAAGQYFFQKGNTDFFEDKKLKAFYDGVDNYIRITNRQGRKSWYHFDPATGIIVWVAAPKTLKDKA